jgi:FMN-dependent NADH-azoreductase
MKTLLQLNSSISGANGASSTLATRFAEAWQRQHADAQFIVRDLAEEPPPHLTAEAFAAARKPVAERSAREQLAAAYADALIGELEQADVLVIGLPMYNFGVPSTLKAWMDHVARAGVTFRYTPTGPEGLLRDKKAYVFATRGGRYAGTPIDTQAPFVRDFLAFLGITDVEFVYAEGLAMGDAQRETALSTAGTRIEQIAA